MKKTISVHLGGRFFHIEEDAYATIEKYLQSLHHHFSRSADRVEIMQDLEARMAEIFEAKLNEMKSVITEADVAEAIGILGSPSDIAGDEEQALSGSEESKGSKRLYRDPDHRVLGGVCSGMGYYFNADPIWFRLGFIATFFFSGPLIYLIAWIIIPVARNTSEKLDMKGDRVNIHNVEKRIKEEFDGVKSRMNKMRDEAENSFRSHRQQFRNADVQGRSAAFFSEVFSYGLRALVVFAAIVLLAIGISLLTGLLVSVFSSGFIFSASNADSLSLSSVVYLIFPSEDHSVLALIGILLLLGIPLLMMIYGATKLLLGYHQKIRIVNLTALVLWLVGLFITLYVTGSTLLDFKERVVKNTEVLPTDTLHVSTLYVNVNDPVKRLGTLTDRHQVRMGQWRWTETSEGLKPLGKPEIQFCAAETEEFELLVRKSSRGANTDDALQCLEHLQYNVAFGDSSLQLDRCFLIPPDARWRNQRIQVILYVPVGKQLMFCNGLEGMDITDEYGQRVYDIDDFTIPWVMTTKGLRKGRLMPAAQDSLQ